MNYKIWRTSSGKEIPLEELTLSHLQNIIKYLEERDEERFYNIMAIGSTFNGEMAQYYSSQAEPEENEWLPYLRQELSKRTKENFSAYHLKKLPPVSIKGSSLLLVSPIQIVQYLDWSKKNNKKGVLYCSYYKHKINVVNGNFDKPFKALEIMQNIMDNLVW